MPRRNKKVFKRVSLMSLEELRTEVSDLRRSIAQLDRAVLSQRIVAVDRTGKKYTKVQLAEVFERLYLENPKAIGLLFPTMSMGTILVRAQDFGLAEKIPRYTTIEDDIIKKFWPDFERIKKELPHRTEKGLKHRRQELKLFYKGPPRWFTPEEDTLIYKGLPVPGRTIRSVEKRRTRLGVNANILRAVKKLSPEALLALVEGVVPKSYPAQVRLEAVQMVMEQCLGGRCWPRPAELAAASKKAITAVYKLHPDRGAPISMDAKLFDDGEATVGDRISSDTFHF